MKENKMKPPYPSTGQAEEVLNLFRRISPKKIDSKFIVENKIATAPNASTVVNFVKWMKIINNEGEVNTNISNKLRLVGDERDKFVKELIETSYEDIFEGINLTEARKDDIVNFFINNYNFGPAPAKSASILFLHLCQKYGIPLSEELKKKTHLDISGKMKRPVRKTKTSSENPQKKIDICANLEEGTVLIEIKGPSGLYFPLKAKSREELDEILENKLPSIFHAIKILLPELEEKIED